ncbi:MAG: hypothetical protein ABIS86_21220 [Streptosporangiaceae bacterium]
MQYLMTLVLQNSETIFKGREMIGIIAGVLAAILASNASWHVTDRVLALRQRRADARLIAFRQAPEED